MGMLGWGVGLEVGAGQVHSAWLLSASSAPNYDAELLPLSYLPCEHDISSVLDATRSSEIAFSANKKKWRLGFVLSTILANSDSPCR